jgi:L-ascorbate metabolism protein UlaG (beta-lactamase superfamily)
MMEKQGYTTPYSAADYAQATDAKLTIACHYDHSSHPVDMDVLKSEFKSADKELKIMEIGESLGI